jgi:hypothetical protein
MRKEKALIMALKIFDTCKKYANADRCLDCPFNVHGCMVTDGNNIPTDWRSSELIKSIEIQGRKER